MAKFLLFLLVAVAVFFVRSKASTATTSASSSPDFIKSSCKDTLYPDLCVQCLSGYASSIQQNDQRLAQTALSVSLARAKSAAAFVSEMGKVRNLKPREYQAVKDCIENMGDSVDRLSQSVKELGSMSGAAGEEFTWHMSNLQTWVSAALTDENTCLDGFSGSAMDGPVKASIKNRVTYVARVTSNALALVNRFASKHDASGQHP